MAKKTTTAPVERLTDEQRVQLAQHIIDRGRFIVDHLVVGEADEKGNRTVHVFDAQGNQSHIGGIVGERIAKGEELAPGECGCGEHGDEEQPE